MRLVSQQPWNDACQHAVIAMLAGKELDEVIRDAGTSKRLDEGARRQLAEKYGFYLSPESYLLSTFGDEALGALVRKHPTLWCSVYSYIEPTYGHAVLFHEGTLYDPMSGLNPSWPWHHHVGTARPVGFTPS